MRRRVRHISAATKLVEVYLGGKRVYSLLGIAARLITYFNDSQDIARREQAFKFDRRRMQKICIVQNRADETIERDTPSLDDASELRNVARSAC